MQSKQKVLAAALAVLASSSLVVGTVGVSVIQHSEGKSNPAYLDPVGIVTACYGHTDKNLRLGMRFTDTECDMLLASDMAAAQSAIKSCTSVLLNKHQMDALTSFVFNVGRGKFCRSSMAGYLRKAKYASAAGEFDKWVYAGKRKLPGLVTRRAKEKALFNSKAPWKSYDLRLLLKEIE